MFEKRWAGRPVVAALMICAVVMAGPAQGQEGAKKSGSVPITFVPPPLENAVYSVGIYEVKTDKLSRRLCEAAGQNTFKTGLNGLITSWDGKDDDGKPLPPGKYAARGYAVGPLKVEGEAILGNDWIEDENSPRVLSVEAIAGVPEDEGLAVVFNVVSGSPVLARFRGKDGSMMWRKPITIPLMAASPAEPSCGLEATANALVLTNRAGERVEYRLTDGAAHALPKATAALHDRRSSLGKNESIWTIEESVLSERSMSGDVLRSLAPKEDEPLPVAVSAFEKSERLYLLEQKAGWQRVRGLAWVDTKEQNGKPVSTWQTFFERNIRTVDPLKGSDEATAIKGAPPTVDVTLDENPLAPGKHEHASLTGTFDEKGSYLSTADGLRLRQISQRTHLLAVRLTEDKAGGGLTFHQNDGAAWDQFSIKGAKKVIPFDAGEFEIDTAGEKPVAEKAPEPDL